MPHMVGSNLSVSVTDKRKAGANTTTGDDSSHLTTGPTIFTANATGTTTTIVGANAAPGTNDNNVVRRGEKFRLFASTGAVKEEKVFEITGVAVAASTTVTFTPAAAVAPVSGDFIRICGLNDLDDISSLDDRLTAINSTFYSAARLSLMSTNDKIFAIRSESDSTGI